MAEKKKDEKHRLLVPHVGNLIAKLRNEKGWTQIELAKRMGIEQGRISGLETRKGHEITLRMAARIADVFGKDVDIFFE